MTEDGERALLGEYLETCARLSLGFKETAEIVAPMLRIEASDIDKQPIQQETFVLAYLKRFEQFEDMLNRTLKAISKIMEHGKIERLTSVDVARRAYALGILASEKDVDRRGSHAQRVGARISAKSRQTRRTGQHGVGGARDAEFDLGVDLSIRRSRGTARMREPTRMLLCSVFHVGDIIDNGSHVL